MDHSREEFITLLQRQEQMEAAGVAQGVRRFRERLIAAQQQGRGSQVGAARKLLQLAVDPMTLALSSLIEEGKSRKGRKHYVEKWINLIEPEPLAYLVSRAILDGVVGRGGKTTLRKCAQHLSSLLVDELRYRRFQDEAPELFNYRMAKFSTSNYAHMAKSLDATMNYAEIDTSDLEMTKQVALVVGIKLVDLFVQSTGLVTLSTAVTNGGQGRTAKKETFIEATPSTLEWLSQRNAGLEEMHPVYMPMLVPPVAWAPGRRGGYRFALRGRHALVRGASKAHAKVIDAAPLPAVYSALNHVQETAWKINPHVLALLGQITEAGVSIAGVPSMVDDPLPPKPNNIGEDKEARRLWRRAAHAVKERNHARKLKAMEFQKTYGVAKTMKDEAAIYFPCNLDFRGRVYNLTNYLHPQGDDLAKSLLTFAEGKPLGEHGAVWLALHGANCLGETPTGTKLSKATLQERVDSIVALTGDIERYARNPLENRQWAGSNVEDPLQFYAFCVEWTAYCEARREGRGEDFVSCLPCAQDGSCNGLQHFSALLLDPIGSAAVNVVPAERPNDIYQRVAEHVLTQLEREASSEPLARLWLSSGLVSRKLTKRPTMTFGYGSKQYGFQFQLIDFLRSHEEWKNLRPLFAEGDVPDKLLKPACRYMAGLIWEALQHTVVAAAQGMAWMQEAARTVVREKGACVSWTVPGTGFPVKQEYMVLDDRQIETVLAGRLYKPRLFTDTNDPDILRQSNGIAPNFVHSLDAAALMLTVNACAERGVTAFAMVHDSYGTHAADCETLAAQTREQFIALYTQHDVIGELSKDLREQAGMTGRDEFPKEPMKGTLDLSAVRESLYFFA